MATQLHYVIMFSPFNLLFQITGWYETPLLPSIMYFVWLHVWFSHTQDRSSQLNCVHVPNTQLETSKYDTRIQVYAFCYQDRQYPGS